MPSRLRVLFVLLNLAGGGAERVVLDVLRRLDADVFDPSLLILKREGVYWDDAPGRTPRGASWLRAANGFGRRFLGSPVP